MRFTFATWEAATDCTGGPAPGARALLAWLLEEYRPPSYSLGIYNCRQVRGAGARSIHSEGRAVDLGLPGTANPLGNRIIERVGPHGRRLGLQAFIWNRRIWSAKSPEGRYYGGTAPHYDHIHFELNRAGGQRLTLATLRAVLASAQPVPPSQDEEEIMQRGDSGPNVGFWRHRLRIAAQNRARLIGNSELDPNNWPSTWNDEPDNQFGGGMQGALNRYKKSHGLVEDGILDGTAMQAIAEHL